MDQTEFIINLFKNINYEKYDDAINYAFDNNNKILKIIDQYISNLSEQKILNIKIPFRYEYYNKFSDLILVQNSEVTVFLFCKIFRIIIYKLIEIYHNLKLLERDELKYPKTKITYVTTVANNENKIKLFCLFLFVYYLESQIKAFNNQRSKKYNYIGIDFEFNNREIALMQINFETYATIQYETNSYIWIINPTDLTKVQTEYLINLIMTNQNIYTILHGSDSLDIPYIYNSLLDNNKENILAFTNKIMDTRFLCEYFRISIGDKKKCSIYHALKFFGTISDKKYDELEEINNSMGPVQDISWDIKKLSSYHVKYTLYDVLFLKHLLMDIYNSIQKDTPQNISAYKIIKQLTRFIFLDRRGIINIIDNVEKDISPINIYLIKFKGENITLINIYNNLIENFEINLDNGKIIDVNFILSVDYFKKKISILLKKIVYYLIIDNLTVYKNKNEIMTEKISLDVMYKELKENNLNKIIYFLNLFQNEALKKINILYR